MKFGERQCVEQLIKLCQDDSDPKLQLAAIKEFLRHMKNVAELSGAFGSLRLVDKVGDQTLIAEMNVLKRKVRKHDGEEKLLADIEEISNEAEAEVEEAELGKGGGEGEGGAESDEWDDDAGFGDRPPTDFLGDADFDDEDCAAD